MVPDGTVFIFGGVDSTGRLVEDAEIFDPEMQAFTSISSLGLTARARHTATLLTDGRLLIAGGLGVNGRPRNDAELWDFEDQTVIKLSATLTDSRYNHSATLLADGKVLLAGGLDSNGNPLDNGELFDPSTGRFTAVSASQIQNLKSESQNLEMAASLPADGSVDVPLDSLIAVRFSRPLRVETVNSDTVILSGPNGIEQIKVVPAEAGMLAFMTPKAALLPGTTYTVTLNGPTNGEGFLLPLSSFSFTTDSDGNPTPPGDPSPSPPPTDDSGAGGEDSGDDNDWEWKGKWKDGKPHSSWQDLPPLKAEVGVTALAGQALDLKGEPLANVVLEMGYGSEKAQARTDESGRFLLQNIKAGSRKLFIDGRNAHSPKSKVRNPKWGYGTFEYGLEITDGRTNVLPFTVWLTRIDDNHVIEFSSPTVSEVIAKTPVFPGFEVHIPPGTVIYDHEGKRVSEITITRVPMDRPPFPLPEGMTFPAYTTIQPGGAYLHGPVGAHIIYPNITNSPPGDRSNLWHYKPYGQGWYIYGQGTVSEDGTQIVPDGGVSFYSFTGAGAGFPSRPVPAAAPAPGDKTRDGDPVDLWTGLFVLEKTDLFLPDVVPIRLTRTYRPGDTVSRAFGIGSAHDYEIFLTGALFSFSFVDLILPDGGRVHYDRVSSGTGFTDAVFEHTSTPSLFYKSRISWNGSGWDLRLKNGTVYVFGRHSGLLLGITDRFGNKISISRTIGENGDITQITSPNDRWVQFTYDTNRITRVTDHTGRSVNYTYDASGRLSTVTDPNGGITRYTYDASHRMLTLQDPRDIVFLTNEYDANGRVKKQTQADNTTFQFSYTTDANGKVIQTDVTDTRGATRRVTFNSNGYPLSDGHAIGLPEEQAITYVRETGSELLLSATDALNRKTAYTYDAMGNISSMTRLADTPDTVTSTFTYEPTFNQVTSITDPLNHTTTLGRDVQGNLTSVTNPLNQATSISYNSAGQPISITDPLNNTTQYTYDFGDLVAVTDPLGNSTTRFLDAAGRLVSVTNPLGNLTLQDYDSLNRVTKVTDPLSGQTQFAYDPNDNLVSVTDARNNPTSYIYDNMDRLATRTDPLLRPESSVYDNSGNLTQFTDRKLQVTNYAYDALNRRTGVTYADTSTTTYTYDAGNRLTQIVDSLSGTITRTYDGLNRLTSETTPQGSVSYTYDDAGRRLTMTVAGQPTINYAYDDMNRLTQMTQGTSVVSFGYDAASRRTSLTLPNGILVQYGYDAASRVTSITYQNGTTILGDLIYGYDGAGNRATVGGSWARTGIPQTVASTSYNAANHQLTFDDKTLTYDNNGNLTSITDASGTTLYSWNARNQLAGISGPGVNASFVYDGLGRRQKKTINGSLTEFLFDGLNPIQETSGTTVIANILTGLGIDEFLTRTDSSGMQTLIPGTLGSIIAVADATGSIQIDYTINLSAEPVLVAHRLVTHCNTPVEKTMILDCTTFA
jgi:YD repeat-containing protein